MAWGVSQRISGFGKKHGMRPYSGEKHEQLRRQIIRSKLLSSSVLWPAREIALVGAGITAIFLVQQSRLFAPLMSGYSITGALKLIELSSVRARFAAIFPQRAGICRIKYPICTQPWVGGLNSMSDMWWTGGLQDGLLLNPVNVIQYHQAGEEKECQEYKRNPFIKGFA